MYACVCMCVCVCVCEGVGGRGWGWGFAMMQAPVLNIYYHELHFKQQLDIRQAVTIMATDRLWNDSYGQCSDSHR